jgi:hypothetical protein
MKAKLPARIVDAEAASLRAAFDGHEQTTFVRTSGFPGTASMVSQHLHGRRPLNLEHAVAYCAGLGVPLERLSPRLAALVRRAHGLLQDQSTGAAGGVVHVEMPAAKYSAEWPFKSLSPAQWRSLTGEQTRLIESMARQLVEAQQTSSSLAVA